MRTLLITDIHGDTDNLEKIIEKEDFEAILCAGDLSDAREFDDYEGKLEEVLDLFDKKDKLVKAVPGNMDPEEACVKALRERRINLHRKIGSFDGFEAVGYGGGITPFGTPFEPSGEEIKTTVETLSQRMKSDTRLAVIHQPPSDCDLDIADGEHVGSPEVRELLEESEFDLVLTGHIHESRGRDSFNGTVAVNPGPVMEGYYAVAEIGDGIAVEMKEL